MMRTAKLAIAGMAATVLVWPGEALLARESTRAPGLPDLSPSSVVGWLKTGNGDEFLPPDSGPGPVLADHAHPYVPNGGGRQETAKIADITNPILKPWAAEQMKKANDEVLAGKIGFTARSRCWPHGVPGFLLYPVHPIFFIQTTKEVLMVWGQDSQLRRVYLDRQHSADPKPSWYGESVGHYENGDTLVVDTIGLNGRTYVDNYRTPHTTALHVVERFRIVDGGKELEVKVNVEDPGAFTTPWNAVQKYRRVADAPLEEMVCADNNGDILHQGLAPMPQAGNPDF